MSSARCLATLPKKILRVPERQHSLTRESAACDYAVSFDCLCEPDPQICCGFGCCFDKFLINQYGSAMEATGGRESRKAFGAISEKCCYVRCLDTLAASVLGKLRQAFAKSRHQS